MLLCVILVWPTKFENFLSFMQNMFVVWEFKDNWLKTLFLGHLGSIQVFFLRAFHLILMYFIHKIQCFEEFLQKIALFFKKIVFFLKIWWASAWFDWSNLFFEWSKFLKFYIFWEREPLSVSTGRGWFSTDRNSCFWF